MRRRIALLAAVAVLVTACAGARQGHGDGSGGPGHPSAWEAVNAQIGSDGRVDTTTALQAFALAFGPLPGVSVPPGPVGTVESGSGALRWLVAHWSDISAAQRHAAIALEPSLQTSSPPSPTAFRAVVRPTAATPNHPPAYYGALAAVLVHEIEGHVGIALHLRIDVAERRPSSATARADTGVFNASGGRSGRPATCRIRISPTYAFTQDVLEGTLAHELWHCFEGQIAGLQRYWSGGQNWIYEGQATWVDHMIRPAAVEEGWWDRYLSTARTPLFARSYDAIGFYAHLSDDGVDTWHALAPMLRADDDRAAVEAAGADSERFLDTWASSFFDVPSLGAPWTITPPGGSAGNVSGPIRTRLELGNAESLPFSTGTYANGIYQVVSHADVTLFAVHGHARLGDDLNHGDYLLDDGARFCTRSGGCRCPPGSTYSGPPLTNLDPASLLAVTGGPDGTYGAVTGQSLDRFCRPKPASSTPNTPSMPTTSREGQRPATCPVAFGGYPLYHTDRQDTLGILSCDYVDPADPQHLVGYQITFFSDRPAVCRPEADGSPPPRPCPPVPR